MNRPRCLTGVPPIPAGPRSALLLSLWFCGACRPSTQDVADAALLVHSGQLERAVALLETASRRPQAEIAVLKQLVRLYATAGDWAGVQKSVDRLAMRVGPGSPEPWLQLGYAFELQHDFAHALEAYDRAAAVAPAEAIGPSVGGRRAAKWGQWVLAASRLREAVARDPSDSGLHHALGYVLFRSGQLEGARDSYRRGLQQDSGAWANQLGLATVALAAQQPAQAAAEYRRLLVLRPEYLPAYLGYSWALGLSGRAEEARMAASRALQMGCDPEVVARQLKYLEGEHGRAGDPSAD